MADSHGGYRRPKHPAPVSGPGAMSKRTDGGPADRQAMRDLPNAKYGEQAQFQDIQRGAPMAAADPRAGIIPLSAPSQRPDEPVTAGNPLGAGIGPQAAGIDTRNVAQQDAEAYSWFVPFLKFMANQPGAAPSSRMIVRQLEANLP